MAQQAEITSTFSTDRSWSRWRQQITDNGIILSTQLPLRNIRGYKFSARHDPKAQKLIASIARYLIVFYRYSKDIGYSLDHDDKVQSLCQKIIRLKIQGIPAEKIEDHMSQKLAQKKLHLAYRLFKLGAAVGEEDDCEISVIWNFQEELRDVTFYLCKYASEELDL